VISDVLARTISDQAAADILKTRLQKQLENNLADDSNRDPNEVFPLATDFLILAGR
jgi:hypothetical protein